LLKAKTNEVDLFQRTKLLQHKEFSVWITHRLFFNFDLLE